MAAFEAYRWAAAPGGYLIWEKRLGPSGTLATLKDHFETVKKLVEFDKAFPEMARAEVVGEDGKGSTRCLFFVPTKDSHSVVRVALWEEFPCYVGFYDVRAYEKVLQEAGEDFLAKSDDQQPLPSTVEMVSSLDHLKTILAGNPMPPYIPPDGENCVIA